jgi:hypothetical protein
MKKVLSLTALCALLVGCSNTRHIGSVGNVEFYRVHSARFTGPNFTAFVVKNGDDVQVNQVYGGPGIGGATISAIGHVGAAAVLGTSFPKNVGDNTSVVGGNANAGGGSAASTSGGGNATGGGSFVPPGHVNNPGHGGNH